MHRVLRFDVLMAHHRLHQMFGRRLAGAGGVDFFLAQSEAGGEYRQKAITANRIRADVGQGNQRQRQVIIRAQGAVVITDAQRQGQPTDAAAHPVTGEQTDWHCPEQTVQHPIGQSAGLRVGLQQQQAENHERERDAVVEPGFSGKTKAYAVDIPCVVDLHQSGQHRVGRCQHRPDQQRRPPRQLQAPVQQHADPGDGHDHHRARQPERNPPTLVAQRQTQLQPADKQRKQYRHFREVLHPYGSVFQ